MGVNEFEDATFSCHDAIEGQPCATSGSIVLAQLGFVEDGVIPECFMILVAIAVAFNALAFMILVYRKPSFLALKAEAADEGAAQVEVGTAPDAVAEAGAHESKVDASDTPATV